MGKRSTVSASLLILTILFLQQTSASEGFFDDFSDGSVTNDVPLTDNGTPVKWEAAEDAMSVEVTDDGMVVTGATQEAVIGSAILDLEYSDFSIRTQARILESDSAACLGFIARFDPNASLSSSYLGYICSDMNAYLGIGVNNALDSAATSIDISQDEIMMRMDVVGSEVTYWAWPVGEEMPTEPLVQAEDSSLAIGNLGVVAAVDENGRNIIAAFRFVEVVPIPEPSSAVLGLVGGLALLMLRGQRP